MASRNGQSRSSSLLILLIASLLSLGTAALVARLLPKKHYQAIAGDQQGRQALMQSTQQIMSKRNRTLGKQLNDGLCGASKLV